MAGISIDASELNALGADLAGVSSGLASKIRPVVHRGANNIKRQLRSEMGASRHFGQAARAIDYSMKGGMVFGVGIIEAEIGPRKGSPGSIANVAIFGTSRGGGTVADPVGALNAEAPNFEKALGDIIGDIL